MQEGIAAEAKKKEKKKKCTEVQSNNPKRKPFTKHQITDKTPYFQGLPNITNPLHSEIDICKLIKHHP